MLGRAVLNPVYHMHRRPNLLLLSILLLLLFSGCVTSTETSPDLGGVRTETPYIFSHRDASAFAATLEKHLSTVEEITPADIDSVYYQFSLLPREDLSRDDLFELKFLYEHWRNAVQSALIGELTVAGKPSDLERIIACLDVLDLAVDRDDLDAVGTAVGRFVDDPGFQQLREGFYDLVALQGDSKITRTLLEQASDRHRLVDGPDRWLKIPPSYKSAWPFERWQKHTDLTEYYRNKQGNVVYRGIELENGDVLIVNLQNPSEGLFSVALRDRKYSPHMAVYVEVTTDNGLFPAVYEMHQYGPRLVPLHIFLSADMVAYVEIYRHRAVTPDLTANLGGAARQLAAEEHGFNLLAGYEYSQEHRFLTCVTACQVLFERGGIYADYPDESTVAVEARSTLLTLGFDTTSYLAPTDLIQWSALALIGIVDNGYYLDNIARQLINERMSERIRNNALVLDNSLFKLFRWASGLILKDAPLIGPLLRVAFGFTEGNFPEGPAELLAFMELIQIDVNKSVENLIQLIEPALTTYPETTGFSIHGMLQNSRIQLMVDTAMEPTDTWFSDASSKR